MIAIAPDTAQREVEPYAGGLPAFGSVVGNDDGNGQALSFLTKLATEQGYAREDPVKQATSNAKSYQWGQERQPFEGEVVSNEIMGCVLAITDLQTREPEPILIRPVQTRDRPDVFWIGPPVDERVAMLTGLPLGLGMEPEIHPFTGLPMQDPVVDPMTGEQAADPMTGQPLSKTRMQPATTYEPMDELTAWQLKKLATAGMFPAEWMVAIDDRLIADVYQTVFDVMWKESKLEDFVYENVLKTNIYGYQGSYYSWDDRQKKHVVRDVSIKQLLLDGNAEGSSFELQNSPGYEIVMDIDQAKAEWPEIAEMLQEYAQEGEPARVDNVSEFGVASDRHFGRRTVTFRVHFFRNQNVPMLPQEAEAAGLVVSDGMGGYYSADATSLPSTPDTNQSTGGALDGESESENPLDPLQQHPDMGTAGPGEVQSPSWPMTLAIRELAALANAHVMVRDRRCEHWDIPMMLNVCIPLPSQPFGQGLPEKLKGMQEADIRLLTACVKYAETFSNPGSMIPQSVADSLKKGLKRMHVDPTETLIIPDDLARQWGEKAIMWFQPPALPPAVADVMAMLQERTQRTSGNSEVMQGKAPSPSSSGRLVEALQAGQSGMAMFQAQWTARMRERLANLMHYTHLWRLELADIMQIYSRLPEPIMKMVIERARRNKWDNHVDASSGGAANRKLQQALALFSATSSTGEPAMPLRKLREAANLDDEECTLAYRQEVQNTAGMAPQPQPGGDPGSNDPSGANQNAGQPAMA